MMLMHVSGPVMPFITTVVPSLILLPIITAANKMAAVIAEKIGEDPTPYREEAGKILRALNARLWLSDRGHWAEYQDYMGHRRLHESAGSVDHLSCPR